MSPLIARWLRGLKTRRSSPAHPAHRPRLCVEPLEDRAVPATHTWIGPAGGNWSVATNWNGGVPTSGESGGTVVVFGSGTTSNQNIAGLVVDRIEFTGSSNTITLTQNLGLESSVQTAQLINASGTNTITRTGGASINLTGNVPASFQVDGGTLSLGSPLTGTQGFRKLGAATLTLSFGGSTYSGPTAVTDGTLVIDTANSDRGLGQSTNITVGDGTGATESAVLRLMGVSEIADTAGITVNADGLFDVIGNDDIGNLSINGGSVTIAVSGTLDILTGGTVTTASPASQISSSGLFRLGPGGIMFNIADGAAASDLNITAAIGSFGLGTSGLTKTGPGTLTLQSTVNSTYLGPTVVADGTLILNTNTTDRGLGLSTSITVGDGTGSAGSAILRLGSNDAEIRDDAAVTIATDGELDVPVARTETFGNLTVNGGRLTLAANVGVSQFVSVNGTVTLGAGAALSVTLANPNAAAGTVFRLIDNDGTDAIAGTFANLPEGASFTSNGRTYTISYTGGSGNDLTVTLQALPTPPVPPATPAPTPAPPFYSGATVAGNVLTLTGAGVAGGQLVFPLPPGGSAFFADVSGDGRGDVILFLPNGVFVFDGQTGAFFLAFFDSNGDGVRELIRF